MRGNDRELTERCACAGAPIISSTVVRAAVCRKAEAPILRSRQASCSDMQTRPGIYVRFFGFQCSRLWLSGERCSTGNTVSSSRINRGPDAAASLRTCGSNAIKRESGRSCSPPRKVRSKGPRGSALSCDKEDRSRPTLATSCSWYLVDCPSTGDRGRRSGRLRRCAAAYSVKVTLVFQNRYLWTGPPTPADRLSVFTSP